MVGRRTYFQDVVRLCKNATQGDIYCGLNLKNDSPNFCANWFLFEARLNCQTSKKGTRNVFDEDKAAIERGWRPERNKCVVATHPLQNV